MIKPKITKSPEIRLLPLTAFLAKTIKNDDGSVEIGVSVSTHCQIAGYVARELINRLPLWLQKELFPSGCELVAAAHDVGKICPTFQEKIYRDLGQVLNIANPNLDKTIGYHSTVSQVAINGVGKFIPEIIGRHHGYSPQQQGLSLDPIYGGLEWQKQRELLIETLKSTLQVSWPNVVSAIHADVLAGLTCVADWISSGSIFNKTFSAEHCENLVSKALNVAGFIQPHIHSGLFLRLFLLTCREKDCIHGKFKLL